MWLPQISAVGENTLRSQPSVPPHLPPRSTFRLLCRRPLGQNSLTCHLHTAVISAPPQPRVPSLIAAVESLHVLHSDTGYLYPVLLSCLDQWFFSGGLGGRIQASHTWACSSSKHKWGFVVCCLFGSPWVVAEVTAHINGPQLDIHLCCIFFLPTL